MKSFATTSRHNMAKVSKIFYILHWLCSPLPKWSIASEDLEPQALPCSQFLGPHARGVNCCPAGLARSAVYEDSAAQLDAKAEGAGILGSIILNFFCHFRLQNFSYLCQSYLQTMLSSLKGAKLHRVILLSHFKQCKLINCLKSCIQNTITGQS